MNDQVFVPVTDELIYNHPEQIEGPLIPYSAGMECSQWLSIEINPDEEKPLTSAEDRKALASQIKVVSGKVIKTLSSKEMNLNLVASK